MEADRTATRVGHGSESGGVNTNGSVARNLCPIGRSVLAEACGHFLVDFPAGSPKPRPWTGLRLSAARPTSERPEVIPSLAKNLGDAEAVAAQAFFFGMYRSVIVPS